MEINKVYVGDNIEVLKTFPDNSIDSVVTDPPYGISFMGKKWDYDVPSVDTWKEVFRVLKPGGHMLVACGTRTQHRMAVNIEDAGFEIRDIVAWVYGSGFPKSHNIGKAVEATLKLGGSSPKHLRQSRMGEDYKPTGQKDYKKGRMFSSDIEQDNREEVITNKWQGWGTALKPSMELWTLARKPLKGTVAQNILEYGVGGINIDASRVPANQGEYDIRHYTNENIFMSGKKEKKSSFQVKEQPVGRFPANFIHDGSDEVEALFPNTKSSGGSFKASDYKQGEGVTPFTRGDFEGYDDEGSASRFFYVAKASQEERNFGLYDFPKKQKVFNGQSSKPSKDMKGVELKFSTKPQKNIHPTVKPIDLMRYLVRMITPPNGICLDPYLGSGTTAIACEMEKFNYIGIELDEQYVEIAKARVDAVKDYETSLDTKTAIKESIKEDKEKELGIQNIFDFMEEENDS